MHGNAEIEKNMIQEYDSGSISASTEKGCFHCDA